MSHLCSKIREFEKSQTSKSRKRKKASGDSDEDNTDDEGIMGDVWGLLEYI